jgi:membrane-bound serine protease (ClpP class)
MAYALAMLRYLSPIFALILTLFALAPGAEATPLVHVATLEGGVDPGSAQYLVAAIEGAERAGADALLIELDTPGGLVSSTREIVSAELAAEVPIILWVGPGGARAGSAGVFLTLAAHVAVMAPGTTIGAAHPVDMMGGSAGGEDGGDGVMEEKILNDTLAWARTIADQRGRNATWAESAVRDSAAITETEALELGVIDLVAKDRAALFAAVEGRVVQTATGERTLSLQGATVEPVEWTKEQTMLHLLGDPNVLFALIGLGLLGLYIEFHNPGLMVPACVGVLCLVGAGVGLSIIPFHVGGLLLIVAGFLALGAEVWVGGMGAFALAGTVAIVAGGSMLFDVQGVDLQVDLGALSGVALICGGSALAIGLVVAKAQRARVATGAEAMVGASATVIHGGEGGGWVMHAGERWAASWEGTLTEGTIVKILQVDGLSLQVSPPLPPS